MSALPYAARVQQVLVGPTPRGLLLAVFPLASGGAVGLQLQDEDELRRGGVYWLPDDDPDQPARAPRFDELFADLALKLRERPSLRREFLPLFPRALEAAQACLPELTPEALEVLSQLQGEARALDPDNVLGGPFSLEAQLLISLLIFVSEEERYPRPRYKGGAVALERLFQAVGDPE